MAENKANIIDEAAFEAAIQNFDARKAEFGNTYKDIYIAVDRLEDTWKGKASAAFQNKFKEMYDKVEEIEHVMDNIIKTLKDVVEKAKTTEQRVVSTVGNADEGTGYQGHFNGN